MKEKKYLPIDLQFFAENSENIDEEVENQDNSSEENTEENKTYTKDEIAKMKKTWEDEKESSYQEKLQKEITKALEEERRKSKLTSEEREKEEKEKLLDEIQNLKKEREISVLKEKAINHLNDDNLPNTFINFVMAEDEIKIKENIKNLKEAFDKAVQIQVEKRLKGKTPDTSSASSSAEKNIAIEFENALKGNF